MEAIYEFIHAEASEKAFAWFNDLAREIYGLERFPERGAVIPESKKLRHLLFGKKPSTYRIIYALDSATMLWAFCTSGTARGRHFRQKTKAATGHFASTVCFAHGIPFFRTPGHLGFPCPDNGSPLWTLPLFEDWLADRTGR